jgi:hypothetical protein
MGVEPLEDRSKVTEWTWYAGLKRRRCAFYALSVGTNEQQHYDLGEASSLQGKKQSETLRLRCAF